MVGQPNKGLQGMFVMMNAARLGVGNQSLGLTEVAYQNALAYAKDRIQMRSLSGPKAKDKPADPIIVHPDVRKMLLTAKAYAEGGRALRSSARCSKRALTTPTRRCARSLRRRMWRC
jgi:alkylation response protein AidB-like acyl-CoA dehydrogenase